MLWMLSLNKGFGAVRWERPAMFAVCVLWALGASALAVEWDRFEVKRLQEGLVRPMELDVDREGRVFFIELEGKLRVYDPTRQSVATVGELEVTTIQENGLIGLALDPDFSANGWLYLQYSPPDYPGQHISRFTVNRDQNGELALDLSSERLLLKFEEQRDECCHHAGSLEFAPDGCLIIGTGDNTHPGGDSQGYAPIDEREGRAPYDAQKSAANTHSYNGKILRIRPTPEGGYTIPEGNLFPRDGSAGRPEIYAMGCRNPWRVSVDQKTGFIYWGDVGPDAGGDGPRGPRGYDEVNQARRAGNFGWPYFIANNRPYHEVDFVTGAIGPTYDVEQPVNESPFNTGRRELPAAEPALIYYPYGESTEFPVLQSGGRTACAGPVYDYDAALESNVKFPPTMDRTLFIFEWTRHWIMAVHLDPDSQVDQIERFMPDHTFVRPIDLCFGPEGALYVLEYGESWGVNPEARLIRIEYHAGNRAPRVKATAENNLGRAPLTVSLSSEGTMDKDTEDRLTFEWRSRRLVDANDEQAASREEVRVISQAANAEVVFEQSGVYTVELLVQDSEGAQGIASVPVIVGNDRPEVEILQPADGDWATPHEPIPFQLRVVDTEDGTSDGDLADKFDLDDLDSSAVPRTSLEVVAANSPPRSQDEDENTGPPGLRRMKRSDCFNCHAVNQQRVGPPLLEIANKYRALPENLEKSVERVLKGSTGVWGKIPMIPHSQHHADEVREMVSWIYSLEPNAAPLVLHGFVGEIPQSPVGQPFAYYELTATYLDQGADGIPPLTGTARRILRSREMEAEHADQIHGAQVLQSATASGNAFIGAINHDHFLRFDQLHMTTVRRLRLRYASAGAGGTIQVRADELNGLLLAEFEVQPDGGWEDWKEATVTLADCSGRRTIFVRFINSAQPSALMNLDRIDFLP